MNPYPPIIKLSDYGAVRPLPPSPKISIPVTKSVTDLTIKNTVSVQEFGPEELNLFSFITNVESTVWYNSEAKPPHIDIPSADPSRYCFAPLKEDVWIRWKHKNPKLIKESVLQLYCRIGGQLKLIWKKTFTWDDCPVKAKTLFRGDLTLLNEINDKQNNTGLKSVKLDYNKGQFDPFFPGECVTAEHSPYKLVLTVVPKVRGILPKPQSVWMYFDVLVHDIELEWCPDADLDNILPNTNKARNLAMNRSLTDMTDNDNLNGVIPAPGQTKKVYLKSHAFYNTTSELTDITYYNRYKALWGDGPVIPIFAKAIIRKSDGSGVDAPLGLGKVKFMWDWVDKAEPYAVIADASIQTWVDTTRNYKAAVTAESPAGTNCHVDRGGKRGMGAKTCFLPQNGKPPSANLAVHDGTDQMFPFNVVPLNGGGSPFATRKWAAYSYSWASGVLAGKTGVLFQPSRMAGDGYELHVYLAYDTDADMETATPGTISANLHKDTGTFRIWRELDIVKHWRVKLSSPTGTLLSLATSKAKFAKYYIKLNIPGLVDDNLGPWFTSLQNVINGTPPPAPPLDDFIRDCCDPTQHGHLVHLIDYEDWYRKMLAAHGGTDTSVANWANTVNNALDPGGQPLLHAWDYLQGGYGMQPIIKPWTLSFLPQQLLTTEGVVRISFPTLLPGVADLDITFEKRNKLSNRATDLTPVQRKSIKDKLDAALRVHRANCGENNFITFGRGANAVGHQALNVQLSGMTGNTRRTSRLTNVQQALNDLNWELSKESGKSNYDNTQAKLGWGLIIFDAVAHNVLANLLGAQEGIVAVQATDLSNKNLPTGKAFFSPNGTRAFAATLAPNPALQTFEHEIGHALFLCHTYHTQETSDPNYLHQKNSPTAGSCIMHVTPSTGCNANCMFCGFCLVRLWGWSFQMINPANNNVALPVSRTIWYDKDYNQNPGSPGLIPPHPTGGTAQTENIRVVGAITAAGNATLTVTAAGMANSPKNIAVAVALNDDANAVGDKVRQALSGDPDVSAFFKVDGGGPVVKLEAKVKAANDATMNVALDNGTCAGLTAIPNSQHLTAGSVPPPHP